MANFEDNKTGVLEHAESLHPQDVTPKNERELEELNRRKELADFLRTRRERLKPTPDRAIQAGRRRTPGLRREEIAEISGVGATWYTWLEQARDIQPSPDVLERVGKALELDPFEMNHLFSLAGRIYNSPRVGSLEQVPDAVKWIVDHAFQLPVLILGERMDHLYWNEHMVSELHPDMPELCKVHHNWLEVFFLNERLRTRYVDWEGVGRRLIAEFRAAVGDQVGNPWVSEVVNLLLRESPLFAQAWKTHDVRERLTTTIQIKHPEKGIQSFERVVLSPVDAPKLKMILFKPLK